DDGTVKANPKISDTAGGFTGIVDNADWFGWSVAALGDLDGDTVGDLAVGAVQDDDGGANRGAVWMLFLNSNGTVKSHQKISDTQGNFPGALGDTDWLGSSVASITDLDGDGVDELSVGAERDDDGGADRGAVWMLFLNSNGTVKSHQKISDTQGNFFGVLDNDDRFGGAAASLGDLNGDGRNDLVVGAWHDDDGGLDRGAVWTLFIDGTVVVDCPWDLDGSGDVGIVDFLDLLAQWGSNPGGPPDFDDDGMVGIIDFLELLGHWGPCP
ncbi:MAG: integrin alpha, partial [Planctomycetota bacterium]